MDRDDPEQHIAELERQLSDAKTTAGATAETSQGRALTAADIRNVAFSKAPLGKRGYNEDEVDAFLDRVEAWLLNQRDPSLSAAAVQNIAFGKPPLGKRGYNEVEVDAFLARVETEVRRIGGAAAPRLRRDRQAGRWQRRSSSSVS
jgi:DivIVA domain-containing protein